jgi:predicted nucleic acid-binding protein
VDINTLPTNKGDKMARGNNRTINVKIPTVKVINALQTKLDQVKSDYAKQDEHEKKHQKEYDNWKKEIIQFALANVSDAQNLRTNYRSWNSTLNVDFDLDVEKSAFPKEPERDFEQMNSHAYKEIVEEIENAIRILKLTDEEVVSTSTYNSIARYL